MIVIQMINNKENLLLVTDHYKHFLSLKICEHQEYCDANFINLSEIHVITLSTWDDINMHSNYCQSDKSIKGYGG